MEEARVNKLKKLEHVYGTIESELTLLRAQILLSSNDSPLSTSPNDSPLNDKGQQSSDNGSDQDSPLTVEEPTSKVESNSKEQEKPDVGEAQLDISPNFELVPNSNSSNYSNQTSPATNLNVDKNIRNQTPSLNDLETVYTNLFGEDMHNVEDSLPGIREKKIAYAKWAFKREQLKRGCPVDDESASE